MFWGVLTPFTCWGPGIGIHAGSGRQRHGLACFPAAEADVADLWSNCCPMLTVFLEVQSDTLWQALPDGRLYIPLSRTTSLSDAQLGWLSNGSQWISLELYVVGVQQLSFSKACFYMQLSYLLVTLYSFKTDVFFTFKLISQFFKCSNSYIWPRVTVTENPAVGYIPKSRIAAF